MPYSLFERQPTFGVNIHCIVISLVKLTLFLIVSQWFRRRGIQEVRARARRERRLYPAIGLESAVKVLSVWVPLRLMCSGAIMKIGHWTCRVSGTVLPPSLDFLQMAASSPRFWTMYAWLEIIVICAILYIIYVLKDWPYAPDVGRHLKYWLGRMGQIRFRRGRAISTQRSPPSSRSSSPARPEENIAPTRSRSPRTYGRVLRSYTKTRPRY